MKQLLKKSVYSMIRGIAGKKKYQNFFIILYQIGLKGMNLRNINFSDNGESRIVKGISAHYRTNRPTGSVYVFDVGANMGHYSEVLMKEFDGLDAIIHAFEPLPAPFATTKELFHRNGRSAFAHNFGLGNQNGQIKFYVDNEVSELGSIFHRDMSDIDIAFNIVKEITIKRLDDFCVEHRINHIHFLKMDVEGAELEVMKGSKKMLTENRIDFIQFEFGSGNSDSKTFMKDFFGILSENYQLFRILKDGLFEMPAYHNDYEMLVMGNYFAISKRQLSLHCDQLKLVFNF
jgi:FkbM family methyltransferase